MQHANGTASYGQGWIHAGHHGPRSGPHCGRGPGAGRHDDVGPECGSRHLVQWRPAHVPHDLTMRVMRSYGPSAWQAVQHSGWNGGVSAAGRPRDMFNERLHEGGFHFVQEGFTYYVKLDEYEEPVALCCRRRP